MQALASRTDPDWVRGALAHLDEVLVDHAHCEKKAASTAVSLLFKYPERDDLLAPLARLAREELLHFEQVLAQLARRGVRFRHLMPSPYAGRLRQIVRAGEPGCLVDTLLCMALIEARSCERLGLLASVIEEPELAEMYRGLVASEARHHETYLALAARVASAPEVGARLGEVATHEAAVLAAVPSMPRLHA
jgi:tRNA-(ms[2]io[6]A)-hydroxylase